MGDAARRGGARPSARRRTPTRGGAGGQRGARRGVGACDARPRPRRRTRASLARPRARTSTGRRRATARATEATRRGRERKAKPRPTPLAKQPARRDARGDAASSTPTPPRQRAPRNGRPTTTRNKDHEGGRGGPPYAQDSTPVFEHRRAARQSRGCDKIDQSRTQDGSRNVVMSFEIFLTQPLHIRASMPEVWVMPDRFIGLPV